MKRRLAILVTHPVQYHGCWFRGLALNPEIDLEVLFCQRATPRDQAGAGFGVEFDWDSDLLEGYKYRFLQNVARRPRINAFAALDTPELKEIIEQERYDAVVVNGWHYKSAWQAMKACWKTRTPVMVRSDSHLYTSRSLVKRSVKRPFYNWFISRLDGCLAVGQWSREYFLHYGAAPDRLFIVPHSVDDLHFANEAARWLPQRGELRAGWNIDRDTTVFVFAGKFIDKKRPLDFVRAVNQASRRGAKMCGLMVGDGPLRPECEALVKAGNVPVIFTGFLNQSAITKAYVMADGLVLPSAGETWGMVVNEAMLCGRACFVSDRVGCAPDLIISGETGELFPARDIQALATVMARYAERPNELSAMGDNARLRMGRYSVRAAVDGVIHAVNSVTNGKRK